MRIEGPFLAKKLGKCIEKQLEMVDPVSIKVKLDGKEHRTSKDSRGSYSIGLLSI
jgi:hypothetical protein